MRFTLKRLVALCVVSCAAVLGFPALAFASEAEGSAAGIGLLFPPLVEWIPMLIGFIILWAILAKFGWPAFIDMIDRRQATIKDSLEQAESAKVESERLLEENKAVLVDAKKQAAQIVSEATQAAEAVKADITAKAQTEAETMIAKARNAIEAEKKVAITELQASVADLSVSVAGRLIAQDLNDADHRKIIGHYLAEAGTFDAN
ncbi:MAG: F0F1 ATP synthase subunit B [Eggerthellaceae bacterium]|nr:F0F1 ATP synthase subunit B [Eggerthellaceae bacterium]MDR2716072.1 F0F1 ATP synthase subunit B [Coriobacteriaceae bacterium]